jgi:hypothetical protein
LAYRKAILLLPSTNFTKGDILAEVLGTNEIQTLTTGGTGAGSTFNLTFGTFTTGPITWSATNATLFANIQAALDALPNIGPGNTLVANLSCTAGIGTINVTFQNVLASTNVAQLTTAVLSGALTTAITTATAGVAGSNGVYSPYNSGASDGTQLAKCILPFSLSTDATGAITMGNSLGTTGGDNGSTMRGGWAWFKGIFFTQDVPALTSGILTSLGGRMLSGNIAQRGEFYF